MSDSSNRNKDQTHDHIEPETTDRSKMQSTMNYKAAPLLKQNETKQRTATAAAGAIFFFKENFKEVGPYIKQDLIQWTNMIGEPLVLAAMKRALERGKGNWGYIKGIMQDWLSKGFTTVQETEDEALEFIKRHKQKTKRTGESWNGEVVPDWFYERNKQWEPQIETEAEAKERIELEKLIAKSASG